MLQQQIFQTGIGSLDERLNGGIPPGSIVALIASPTSQSEQFLAQLIQSRPTMYLSTQRSAPVVLEGLEYVLPDIGDCTVYGIDPYSPFSHVRRLVGELEDDSMLVIDTASPFESDDDKQLQLLLNEIKDRLRETNSVAVLHCIEGHTVPPHRDTTEYMADVVFDLDTAVYGDAIENRLFIPKLRRGEAVSQAIKLDLSRGVTIDTSRDIS